MFCPSGKFIDATDTGRVLVEREPNVQGVLLVLGLYRYSRRQKKK